MDQERLSVARTLLMIEKEKAIESYEKGDIGKDLFEMLISQLDNRALNLGGVLLQGIDEKSPDIATATT